MFAVFVDRSIYRFQFVASELHREKSIKIFSRYFHLQNLV